MNTEQHIVDWDSSLELAGGDHGIAREIIRVCSEDLNVTLKILSEAYQNKDTQALRHELHRVKGGVCYLKAPELMDALNNFHASIKAVPQASNDMASTYEGLLKAIMNFQEASKNLI